MDVAVVRVLLYQEYGREQRDAWLNPNLVVGVFDEDVNFITVKMVGNEYVRVAKDNKLTPTILASRFAKNMRGFPA